MTTLGVIAMWVGLVLMLVGGVLFIIAAFRESILWGLGVLLLPIVSLVFLILNWSRAKGSFFLQLYGFAFILLGVLAFEARLPTPWR
jgi:hypothetical protein